MKKLLFSIILTFYVSILQVSISQAGLIYDDALWNCNGSSCTLKYGMSVTGAVGSGITVGTSVITGGTNGYLLYNNAGILGNLNPAGLTLAFTQITGTVPINQGGTGQTTANTALNALLPSQTSNSGKVLGTNGTNTSWVTSGSSAFTSRSSAFLNNASFSVNSATYTTIQFDTLVPGFGSTSEFDLTTNKGRFTSTSGGIYSITSSSEFNAVNATGHTDWFWRLDIWVNNAQYATGQIIWSQQGAVFYAVSSVASIIHLSPGDFVEVTAYQNTGSSILLLNGSSTTVQIAQIQ